MLFGGRKHSTLGKQVPQYTAPPAGSVWLVPAASGPA